MIKFTDTKVLNYTQNIEMKRECSIGCIKAIISAE